MNRLDVLIAEFCPDGVEYRSLESICNISKGVQFNKSNMQDEGTYPVINGGINPSGYIEQFNQNENTITVSQGGASAGYVNWISVKFWAGAHCYVLKPSDYLLNRFLFHFVKSQEYKFQERQYGAGIPALAKSTLAELPVPVPPLPVQQEIVRILDTFTELTARKKQYEYYRDELLTFGDDVEYKKIKDIYTRIKGTPITARKMKVIESLDGDIRIFAGGKTVINAFEEDIPNANITRVPAVLVQSRGVIDAIFYEKPFTFKNEMWAYTTENRTSVKYLYYVLKNNIQKFRDAASGMGSMPQISLKVTEEFVIPFPPQSEQQRIVDILDRFDALCNDISIGLPAEIEARQKQYEYYRDKLLAFKEIS